MRALTIHSSPRRFAARLNSGVRSAAPLPLMALLVGGVHVVSSHQGSAGSLMARLRDADSTTVLRALEEVTAMTRYDASLLSPVSRLLQDEHKEVRFAAAYAIDALATLDGCFADGSDGECNVMLEAYDKLPVATKTVQPKYPGRAIEMRQDASVRMKVLVDARGRVVNVRVLGPASIFALEAVRAAKRWRFEPAEREGTKVPIVGVITTTFSANDR